MQRQVWALVVFVSLLFQPVAWAHPGTEDAPQAQHGPSTGKRVVWTLIGAGIGFGAGLMLGLQQFDDAIDSDRKVWTTALVGAGAGGVAGALLSGVGRGSSSPAIRPATALNPVPLAWRIGETPLGGRRSVDRRLVATVRQYNRAWNPRISAEQSEPRISAAQTEPQIAAEQNEPRTSADRNEPRISADQSEPRISAAQTEPRISAEQTEPRISADQSEPRISAAQTEPRISAAQTEPRISAEQNEPQIAAEQTEPRTSADRNEPRIFADETESRISQEQSEPRISADRSEPRIFADETEPRRSADSLRNGMIAGAIVGGLVGLLIVPATECKPSNPECPGLLRIGVGIPAVAGGAAIGALVDKLFEE